MNTTIQANLDPSRIQALRRALHGVPLTALHHTPAPDGTLDVHLVLDAQKVPAAVAALERAGAEAIVTRPLSGPYYRPMNGIRPGTRFPGAVPPTRSADRWHPFEA